MPTIDCLVQGRRLRLRLHPTELFVPNLMSWYSAAQMHVFPGETFCDVGLGSGLHAILAAKLGARRAYGTDISPVALRWARENARLNGVDGRCRFLSGSLAAPLAARGIRVDALVYNAPQFPGTQVDRALPSRLQASVDGGPSGGELSARFLREAAEALKSGGRIYNPVVGWAGPSKVLRAMRRAGFRTHELSRIHVPPWGRGNRTRDWFQENPGRHDFRFRHHPGRDTLARVFELRLDGRKPATPPKSLRVRVDFRPDAADAPAPRL